MAICNKPYCLILTQHAAGSTVWCSAEKCRVHHFAAGSREQAPVGSGSLTRALGSDAPCWATWLRALSSRCKAPRRVALPGGMLQPPCTVQFPQETTPSRAPFQTSWAPLLGDGLNCIFFLFYVGCYLLMRGTIFPYYRDGTDLKG